MYMHALANMRNMSWLNWPNVWTAPDSMRAFNVLKSIGLNFNIKCNLNGNYLILFDGGMVAGHFLLTDGLIKNIGVPMGANVVPKSEQNLTRDYFVGCVVARTKE